MGSHACVSALGALSLVLSFAAVGDDPPIERELRIVIDVDAVQDWKKNDPKYPGDQWSKGRGTHHIELTTRLRADRKLEVRNLLDPDLATRLEAKTIHLARQAKRQMEKSGKPFKLPQTPEEIARFQQEMNTRLLACNAEPNCYYDTQFEYAALTAAIQNPEALEEDAEPGRYLYFMAYDGCPEHSRVTVDMTIEGIRYNKDVDEFIPFKERHTADSVDESDGRSLCKHLLAVVDTQDPAKPMYQETVFIPRPVGMTEYTENGHTSREKQPQPIITAVYDWANAQLRHAPAEGVLTTSLPLPLPLNQNATWLGLWTGTAKVTMRWSFKEVPTATPVRAPQNAPRTPK